MIVAKFGGTAVTPRNLIYLKRIVTKNHCAVVVSAVGREYKDDVKVTDLLLDYYETGNQQAWATIADKYRRLVEVNGIAVDVEALLSDARLRAASCNREYCASLGEELSARIVAAFLGTSYVEAENVIRFDEKGVLDAAQTYSNVRDVFCDGKQHVLGGFYGGGINGRKTFSRGGGDVTGAIVAAALNASLYENWTDVNGVCVANPAKVHNVATVAGMSYAEMRMLSLAGAEVLHPDAVAPCQSCAIPIRIGNFFNPDGADTLVTNCPSYYKLLSVAEKEESKFFVTTVLHSCPLWEMAHRLECFLKQSTHELHLENKSYSVDSDILRVELSEHTVRLYSRHSILNSLYGYLINSKI